MDVSRVIHRSVEVVVVIFLWDCVLGLVCLRFHLLELKGLDLKSRNGQVGRQTDLFDTSLLSMA